MIHQKTIQLLRNAIGEKEFKNAKKCSQYLKKQISEQNLTIKKTNILICYGGGKDSTWVMVFMRLVQLILRREYGETFRLNIITMIHLGSTQEVIYNINSVFSSLKIFEDPDIEFPKIYSYGYICDFSLKYSIPKHIKKFLREDILVAGHRTHGDPRSTFCGTCNLHMIDSFISQSKNIHFIITGDSSDEKKSYFSWIQRTLEKLNLPIIKPSTAPRSNLKIISNLKKKFLLELFPKKDTNKRLVKLPTNIYPNIKFLPIFNFTNYSIKKHWGVFRDFLNFNFSEETLNFTESDCKHPALMIHLRGLKAELEGKSYEQGIKEYLELAKFLMIKKEFHKDLIEENLSRYSTSEKIKNTRIKAEKFASNIGLSKQHLISMILSPICEKGKNLKKFLETVNSPYCNNIDSIHEFLQCKNNNEEIEHILKFHTGLNKDLLRHLYKYNLLNFSKSINTHSNNILYLINKNDPHKKEVKVNKNQKEIISGR